MADDTYCNEMVQDLAQRWNTLRNEQRAFLLSQMVRSQCHEVIPFLIRQAQNETPEYRWRAIYDLSELRCRDCRQLFIDFFHKDPDVSVRKAALVGVSSTFSGEQDSEILRLALSAFDDPGSGTEMQLAAGAVMMNQLGIVDPSGPPWWNGEPEDLAHPAIMRAVELTRQRLALGSV